MLNQIVPRPAAIRWCAFKGDDLVDTKYAHLQPPAIIKPLELWTGKQLLSMLLRPAAACPVFVNIQIKEKGYTTGEHMCPKDGFVAIVNSELISGRVGKALLGGSKAGLFSMLAARYSPATAGASPGSTCPALPLLSSPFLHHAMPCTQCPLAVSLHRSLRSPRRGPIKRTPQVSARRALLAASASAAAP